MTQTFNTNENNDIFIDSTGNLSIISGEAAIEAACATATKAQLGEMVFATQSGIPNFNVLWVGTPDYSLWKAAILETLQGVSGVTQVNSLNLSISGKTVSYIAQIMTTYSQNPITITG